MLAIWTTILLTVGAVAVAMTLGWRKWAAQPVRVEAREIDGPGCFPRVTR